MGGEQSTQKKQQQHAPEKEAPPYAYASYSLSKSPAGKNIEDHILVVSPGIKTRSRDPELEALERTPLFYPILKKSLGIHSNEPEWLMDKLDSKQLLALCMRYVFHVRACGERVSREQEKLGHRIKEVEARAVAASHVLSDRVIARQRVDEKLSSVSDMKELVDKSHEAVKDIMANLSALNDLLPPEHQLEPLAVPE